MQSNQPSPSAPTLAAPAAPAAEPAAKPDVFKSAFDAIDAIGNDSPSGGESEPQAPPRREVAPKVEEKPKPEAKAPEDEKPEVPAGFDEDLVGLLPKKKTEQAKKSEETVLAEEPKTPKALREAYETGKNKLTAAEKRVTELEAQIKAAESAGAERAAKALQEKLVAAEKKAEQMEVELRFLDYTKTGEFTERYTKPIEQAWANVQQEIAGLKLHLNDDETRDATGNDILELVRMDPARAREVARKVFPEDAAAVMPYVSELRRLYGQKSAAEKEWRDKGSEWTTQRAKAQEEATAKMQADFEGGIKKYQTEFQDFFGADPKDQEASGYLANGNKLVRLAMLQDGLPEGMSQEEKLSTVLKAQTKLAAQGAAFPVVRLQLNRAKDRIAELEKELAEFKSTEPKPGEAEGSENGSRRQVKPADSIDAAIDALPAMRI